jgi:hypothetical protein
MKYLKTIGLVTAVTCAFAALLGASTAAAESTLCTKTPTALTNTNCPTPGEVGAGTVLEMSQEEGTLAIFTASGGLPEVTCEKSSMTAKLETATTPKAAISSWTFSGCSSSVTVLKVGALTVHHDGEHNGVVTLGKNAAGGVTEVRIEAGGLSCVFGGEVAEGITMTGGNPYVLHYTSKTTKLSGSFLCPSSTTFHISMKGASAGYVGTGV